MNTGTMPTNGNGRPHDEPPQNARAEKDLLLSMFALPEAADAPEVAALRPGDFFDPAHRILYRHLVGIRLEGRTLEVLPARLSAAGEYEQCRAVLAEMMTAQVSGSDARYYASLITESAKRRKQWELSRELAQQVADGLPIDDIDGLLSLYVETIAPKRESAPFKTADEMLDTYQELRPYVIHQVVRASETINIVAPSKRGKSWFVLLLAFCIATGARWLGMFSCRPGRVLLVDNELHNETLTDRIRKVAEALGLRREEYGQNLVTKTVRGQGMDINGLVQYLAQFKAGDFQVIVLDALYRFYPKGFNENENADMTWLYNLLDGVADRLQCVIICIVHSSKGSQADKSVVDTGSGAGAMARATDSHMALRQHEEPDAIVLELAPRSSPPLDPVCLRFKWPLWTVDESLDPADLHRPGKKKSAKEVEQAMTADRFAAEFGTPEPKPMAALIEAAVGAGLGERKAANLVRRAAAIGKLYKWPTDDKREFAYATTPAPVVKLPKAAKSKGKQRKRKAG